MSKKDLTKPIPNRQPQSDEIDTFVRAGAGNDTVKQDSVNTELKKFCTVGNRALNSGFGRETCIDDSKSHARWQARK